MVLLKSVDVEFGSDAPDFSLEGVDGELYSLSSFEAKKALVVVFMCNHCPYVQMIWDDMVALQAKFADRGVQFVGVNPNTVNVEYEEETMEKMKEYYEKYKMNFPYLEDVKQDVARAYDAQCTPDIYLYDEERKLVYHGRLDEMGEALEELLSEGKIELEQKPAMGCSIKWV